MSVLIFHEKDEILASFFEPSTLGPDLNIMSFDQPFHFLFPGNNTANDTSDAYINIFNTCLRRFF